jgi:multidrug efflux pump subunit AcrB
MFGTVLALWVTGTSLDVVSLLGAVIGALCISVLLSLIATPTIYCLLVARRKAG